jgi:putative transposon-encoded protein
VRAGESRVILSEIKMLTPPMGDGKESEVPTEKKSKDGKYSAGVLAEGKVKFEVYGEEMIEKKVKLSGNSGRVYLPPDWVHHHVKIIRMD